MSGCYVKDIDLLVLTWQGLSIVKNNISIVLPSHTFAYGKLSVFYPSILCQAPEVFKRSLIIFSVNVIFPKHNNVNLDKIPALIRSLACFKGINCILVMCSYCSPVSGSWLRRSRINLDRSSIQITHNNQALYRLSSISQIREAA